MSNTIRPRPSLMASSQALLKKTQELNTASTGARAALGQSTIRVGSGQNRQKAQSAGETIKGLLTSLSNALKAVLYSPVALVKALHSYSVRPSRAETSFAPKDAMARVSQAADSSAASVHDFLNSNAVTKDVFREIRDTVSPPSSTLDALGREAGDTATDFKGAVKGMLEDAKNLFKAP